MNAGKLAFFVTVFLLFNASVFAENSQEGEEFNPGTMISHHITDAHEWHFASFGGNEVAIPLPVILYTPENGAFHFFSSSHFYHSPDRTYAGFRLDEHEHIHSLQEGVTVFDLSITKNVTSLMISIIILLGIFLSVASAYKKNPGSAPRGLQSFFEPIILYIRDDVARPNIGPNYNRYMPYLLTIFFFIWFNNLLGLIPGAANVTGNIAVTGILAILTFLITSFSGNKYYWGHIFWTPGVPTPLKFIIVPIEVIGMFIKPFALMVRLFANITAGHIIILSLLGLIFLFENWGVAAVSIPFSLFMMCLELFVAILQAYIFTLLSAMYIGAAVEEHHHDEHDVDPALYM